MDEASDIKFERSYQRAHPQNTPQITDALFQEFVDENYDKYNNLKCLDDNLE